MLEAGLGRRGIKSTALALGVAVGGQAGIAGSVLSAAVAEQEVQSGHDGVQFDVVDPVRSGHEARAHHRRPIATVNLHVIVFEAQDPIGCQRVVETTTDRPAAVAFAAAAADRGGARNTGLYPDVG